MNYKFEDNDFNNCELNKSLDMSIQAFLNKKKEQYIDNDFFHQIFEIVFKYTGNYRKKIFSKEDVNFELIKDCIYIAKYYFKEGVLERSIDKILLGVIIVDFFSQNFDILEIELNRTELVKLVSNLLTSLNINIGIPDDAPYNEKKLYAVYSEAKKENEYNNHKYNKIGIDVGLKTFAIQSDNKISKLPKQKIIKIEKRINKLQLYDAEISFIFDN